MRSTCRLAKGNGPSSTAHAINARASDVKVSAWGNESLSKLEPFRDSGLEKDSSRRESHPSEWLHHADDIRPEPEGQRWSINLYTASVPPSARASSSGQLPTRTERSTAPSTVGSLLRCRVRRQARRAASKSGQRVACSMCKRAFSDDDA